MVAEPQRSLPPSTISLVPRQVSLAMNAAASEQKAKDKKAKKEKKASKADLEPKEDRSLDLKRCGGLVGEARAALLRSIAAFLESNGFSRTLAAFRSEAQLEKDNEKGSSLDLEDILCKFLELSKSSLNEKCISKLQVDEEKTISGKGAAEVGKPDLSSLTGSGDVLITYDGERFGEKKQKKRKNKLTSESQTDDGELSRKTGLVTENLHEENNLTEAHEESKPKKKKTKETSSHGSEELREFVQEKLEDLNALIKSNACQLDEAYQKSKKKKRTSDLEASHDGSKMAGVSEHADIHNIADNQTDDMVSAAKDKKKRKKKSSTEIADEMNECHDLKAKDNIVQGNLLDASKPNTVIEKALAVDETTDNSKSKKSKRKKSAIEGNSHPDGIDSAQALGESKGGSTKGKEAKQDQKLSVHAPSEGKNDGLHKKQKTEDDPDNTKTHQDRQSGSLTKENGNTIDERKVHDQKSNGTFTKNENGTPASLNVKVIEESQSAETKSAKAFQRVKVDEVKFVDERLRDNSYWAKSGADSGYGAKAQEVLGQVKGRDFRHEKTKKKRGSYRGGQIDFQSHSVKFNYSDEE